MKETQFQCLIILVGGIGTFIIIELFMIESRLRKIYEAIGLSARSIESEIRRLKQ